MFLLYQFRDPKSKNPLFFLYIPKSEISNPKLTDSAIRNPQSEIRSVLIDSAIRNQKSAIL